MQDFFVIFWLMSSLLAAEIVARICSSVAMDDAVARIPDEQRLLKRIMRHYDNSVRPAFHTNHTVVVNFSLTLVQIMDMDEKNQVLVSKVWLEHSWFDHRISWDPLDYTDLSIMRIPASKLWLPDIVLYNSADDFTAGYMSTNAMVHSDGMIFWAPPARLRSSCKVDVTYFPFDQQTCLLKFGSWTYDQAQVDIVRGRDFVDMSNYITNGEWSYAGNRIVRNEVRYPIGPEVYPDVTVYVVIRRRILYYVLNIILPCVSLNLLSLLAFCLPPDAGEKVTLGITVLLSYSVFMLLVAENMPATSEFVPLIGIYLTVSMAITSISIILTVWVLALHHCGPHQSAVPRWARRCVLGSLARIVGFTPDRRGRRRRTRTSSEPKSKNKKQSGGGVRDSGQRSRNAPLAASGKAARGGGDKVERFLDLVREISAENDNPVFRTSGDPPPPDHHRRTQQRGPDIAMESPYDGDREEEDGGRGGGEETEGRKRRDGMPAGVDASTTTTTTSTKGVLEITVKRLMIMEETLDYLRFLVAKTAADDRQNEITNEWRNVAAVVDRCLFRVFLFATAMSTFFMMVLMPFYLQ